MLLVDANGKRNAKLLRTRSLTVEIQKSIFAQSCPAPGNPVDCTPPGSSVRGISQARMLEWGPFPSPGEIPDPEIEPGFPEMQADSFLSEPPGKRKCLGLNPIPTTSQLEDFGQFVHVPKIGFPQLLKGARIILQ